MGSFLIIIVFLVLFALLFVLSIVWQFVGSFLRLFGFGKSSGDQRQFNEDGFYEESGDAPSKTPNAEVGRTVQGQQRLGKLKNMAEDVAYEEEK